MVSSSGVVWGVFDEARARQKRRRHRITVAAAATIAVVLALAWTGGGNGGSAPTAARPLNVATISCVSDIAPHTSVRQATPSESSLAILGVLRRPAQPADATAPSYFESDDLVYAKYIRLARVALGHSYYVIPALGSRCKPLKPVPLIMLLNLRRGSSAWLSFGSVEAIDRGGLLLAASLGHRTTVSGLVPDDVAKVTLRYPAAPTSAAATRYLPPMTITARAIDNIIAVTVPRTARLARRPTMTWRAANGTIIKTFTTLS